jgi:hypothetical protein
MKFRQLLPSPGNILFTLLVVGVAFWIQIANAFPFRSTSTDTVAYQGRLADSDGYPLTGSYNITFLLYDVAADGSPLWAEQWSEANAVEVNNGLFNVLLGHITPIPQAVIVSYDTLWLAVKVGNDPEMTPRVQLGNVPYAMQTHYVKQEHVVTNVETVRGDTELSVSAGGHIDLLAIVVDIEEASTLRINFHSLVWKTASAGRTFLGIRIDGSSNTAPDEASLVQVGSQVSANYVFDSQFLSGIYFVDVQPGQHTVALVLASGDNGTSHGRAFSMEIETLKQ